MERTATTDLKLQELSRQVASGFAGVDARFTDLGNRMTRLEQQVDELRSFFMRAAGGVMAGLVATIVGLIGLVAVLVAGG